MYLISDWRGRHCITNPVIDNVACEPNLLGFSERSSRSYTPMSLLCIHIYPISHEFMHVQYKRRLYPNDGLSSSRGQRVHTSSKSESIFLNKTGYQTKFVWAWKLNDGGHMRSPGCYSNRSSSALHVHYQRFRF